MKLRNILVGTLVAVFLAGCGLCETSQPVHPAPMPRGKDESAADHSLKAMDSQSSAANYRAYSAQ